MINLRDRYYVTVAFRGIDGAIRPAVGDILESSGMLFSVKLSTTKWVALIAVIKNKVEYIECLKKFKQDTPIIVNDWYPMSVIEDGKESNHYEKYEGEIVFVGSKEISTSFRP